MTNISDKFLRNATLHKI